MGVRDVVLVVIDLLFEAAQLLGRANGNMNTLVPSETFHIH